MRTGARFGGMAREVDVTDDLEGEEAGEGERSGG